MADLKQMLVGTALGDAAMRLRERLELLSAALGSSESVGTVANDQLAAFLLARLCDPARVFADVGSHIGSVIAAVRRAHPGIAVVAVEAIPDKAERLRRKFPDVEINGCAVGDREDTVRFFVDLERSGYSSLDRPSGRAHAHLKEILVPMKTLDAIVGDRDVDLMKLDIEGAELGALRGAPRTLDERRPVIVFESTPFQDENGRRQREDLWRLLASHRYEVVVPNRVAHDGPALELSGYLESHAYPRRTTNFFAVPAERRIAVRDRARQVLHIIA